MTRVSLIVVALAACSSQSSTPPSDGEAGSGQHDPMFLTLGTNIATVTEGQSIVFSAVLTDPDGIDDLIGGTLKSEDGSISYGAFATAGQEGAYSLTLTWDALQESDDITFKTMGTRTFLAEFFDAAGHKVQQTLTLALTCNGQYACSGHCASSCFTASMTRGTCEATCTAQHAMTCDPGDGARRALYGSASGDAIWTLYTCTYMPPATY